MLARKSLPLGFGFGLGFLLLCASASAQTPSDGSLPPLPPSTDAPQSAPVAQPAQQPGVVVAPAEPAPTEEQVPPPPVQYQRAPAGEPGDFVEPKHAPKFSLYTGLNLGLIGYGGAFFFNSASHNETTGNSVGAGLSFEIDVGARLGKRYIPYVAWEHAFLAPGHRFDDTNTKASSDFVGLGFRLMAGDVDNVAFLSDLGIGFRTVTLQNDSETFKMTSLEIARLGLGAEIRFSKLFTLSPIARISVGQMSQSSGGISYGPNQGDGQTGTTFKDGQIGDNPVNYVNVGLGCGGYFDFFGK